MAQTVTAFDKYKSPSKKVLIVFHAFLSQFSQIDGLSLYFVVFCFVLYANADIFLISLFNLIVMFDVK